MSRIACRLCVKCNKYSDISVSNCACGESFKRTPIVLIDPDNLKQQTPNMIGQINANLVFYKKTCPGCGADNYSIYENNPTELCFICNRPGIRSVKAVRYIDLTQTENKTIWGRNKDSLVEIVNKEINDVIPGKNEEDTILEATSDGMQKTEIIEKSLANSEEYIEEGTTEDEPNWGLCGDTIVFTAFLHGDVTFEIEPENAIQPVVLGRNATQAELLSQDGYVGREHCSIIYRDEEWYVKNENPRNGTFLNKDLLKPFEERKLSENDILILGHNADSMRFKVSFK